MTFTLQNLLLSKVRIEELSLRESVINLDVMKGNGIYQRNEIYLECVPK